MLPPVGTLIVTLGEAADNNAEICTEILGSRVADGPAAKITLSSEERVGRNALGSCEAWVAIAEMIGPGPIVVGIGLRVLSMTPARDEAAAETLGGTVPEGPADEILLRSDDKTGCTETGRSDD